MSSLPLMLVFSFLFSGCPLHPPSDLFFALGTCFMLVFFSYSLIISTFHIAMFLVFCFFCILLVKQSSCSFTSTLVVPFSEQFVHCSTQWLLATFILSRFWLAICSSNSPLTLPFRFFEDWFVSGFSIYRLPCQVLLSYHGVLPLHLKTFSFYLFFFPPSPVLSM